MPAKAMCRALGLPAGQCRLPIGPAPAELDERAAVVATAVAAAGGPAAAVAARRCRPNLPVLTALEASWQTK